jgi:hypothetical protein
VVDYVTNSVKFYNQLARETPDDYLSVSTLKTILKQLRHVISAMFLVIDGYPSLSALFKKTYVLIVLSSIISLVVFIQSSLKLADIKQKKLRFFILLLAIIPMFTLIIFAYQDGNTFRIMPRYVAYSYSFNIVFIVLIISDLWDKNILLKLPISAFYLIQLCFIVQLINDVWTDKTPRYFSYFAEPRQQNPYQFSAQRIQQEYAKGDTILYPSVFIEKRGGKGMPTYSVSDAQLTNFYLPKNSEIIQRININEENKIIIKKANGTEKLIFDFKGAKFRY